MVAEAELALLLEPRLYLGNRKLLPHALSIALEAAHRVSPMWIVLLTQLKKKWIVKPEANST